MLDLEWFDEVQINWQQAPAGMLGIHTYKKGPGCVYFEVPEEWIHLPDFFERIHERALFVWARNRVETIPSRCPACHYPMGSFIFRWRGVPYCRQCGSHLHIDNKRHVTVVRKTGTP